MSSKKTVKDKQVAFQEKNGYILVENKENVAVLRNESNEYIKVDSDGMVVPFKPLNEERYLS